MRIVTAGTVTEDTLLEAGRHNYLVSLAVRGQRYGFVACCWLDISTGDFYVQSWRDSEQGRLSESVNALLTRLQPSEILLSEALYDDDSWHHHLEDWWRKITTLNGRLFDEKTGITRLLETFGASFRSRCDDFQPIELAAAGAILSYVRMTQKGNMPALKPLTLFRQDTTLAMDRATLQNLEIFLTLDGEREGSLCKRIDTTVTAVGARLLKTRLATPSLVLETIQRRLQHVTFFINHEPIRTQVLEWLKHVCDIERSLGRLTGKRGGPQDLRAIADSLQAVTELRRFLAGHAEWGEMFSGFYQAHDALEAVQDVLIKALLPQVPQHLSEGGFIRQGYDMTFDSLQTDYRGIEEAITKLEHAYRQKTRVPNLKILFKEQSGYYIEVPKGSGDALLCYQQDDKRLFEHRLTTANRARFMTSELMGLATAWQSKRQDLLRAENHIFHQLVTEVVEKEQALRRIADYLAHIDVVASHAAFAYDNGWSCPEVNTSRCLTVEEGRHAVIEQMARSGEGGRKDFVPNTCHLDETQRLWLVTGPNMAGKSTFLRQNALIIILAQAGFYVPAKKASIGLVNHLLTRIGADDRLARGLSTFMLEMQEMAKILHQADERSFVILDEIGRGTAVKDGLALAWSAIEYLHHQTHCRGLFSTHYHELTALSEHLDALVLRQILVSHDEDGNLLFLNRVESGGATVSYGIDVARLAGVPAAVCQRADEIFSLLGDKGEKIDGRIPQAAEKQKKDKKISPVETPVETYVKQLQPDNLSPKQALEELYRIKQLVSNKD